MPATVSPVQVAPLLPKQTLTASTFGCLVDTMERIGTLTAMVEIGRAVGTEWVLRITLEDSPDAETWREIPSGKFMPITQGACILSVFFESEQVARYVRARLILDGRAELDLSMSLLGRELLTVQIDA